MKKVMLTAVLTVLIPAAYAQQTCLVTGNVIQCSAPQPQADWVSLIQQNNANASPEADARAALLRQQADLVRLQNELIRQQIEAAKAAAGK